VHLVSGTGEETLRKIEPLAVRSREKGFLLPLPFRGLSSFSVGELSNGGRDSYHYLQEVPFLFPLKFSPYPPNKSGSLSLFRDGFRAAGRIMDSSFLFRFAGKFPSVQSALLAQKLEPLRKKLDGLCRGSSSSLLRRRLQSFDSPPQKNRTNLFPKEDLLFRRASSCQI